MTIALLYLVALAAGWLMRRMGVRHPMLVAMLPMIAADAGGNFLVGGSWRNTLSGEAWHHRGHKWWGWTHKFIDALFFFQPSHCQTQAYREIRYGSVWGAWWADWKSP